MHVIGAKDFPGNPALVSDEGTAWTLLSALEPPDVDTVRDLLGREPTAEFLSRVDWFRRCGGADSVTSAVTYASREKAAIGAAFAS